MTRETYKLRKPVAVGSETVTELNFRTEVVSGDLRGLKVSALGDPLTDDILKIAGRLCGQPDTVMFRLWFPDQIKVTEMVSNFLSNGLETGTEP
jgi:hypothetical protein